MIDHIGRNPLSPIIRRAVREAQIAILGAGGAGRVDASPPIAEAQTVASEDENGVVTSRHRFMIGVDAIGDTRAALLSDGRAYNFGN